MWTFFRRKSEADADLRYKLLDFIRSRPPEEFTAARLLLYKHIGEYAVLSRRSPIGTTTSLRSIYYARYYTSFNLLQYYLAEMAADARLTSRGVNASTRRDAASTKAFHPSPDRHLAERVRFVSDGLKNHGVRR